MRTSKNLPKHELIGLTVVVKASADPKTVRLEGVIVDETKNTFKIATEKGEKTLQKKGMVLGVSLHDMETELDCSKIMFRPEDRIKKVKR